MKMVQFKACKQPLWKVQIQVVSVPKARLSHFSGNKYWQTMYQALNHCLQYIVKMVEAREEGKEANF